MLFKSKNSSLEVKSLKTVSDEDYTILDVRNDKDRYKSDKFIGLNVLGMEEKYLEDLESFVPRLDKEKTYVVVCYKGIRSKAVANKLRGLGITKAKSFVGGYARF